MCAATGKPVPKRIQNAPELLPGLDVFYDAFNCLSTTRQIGMGLGPIPWTCIQAYADEYGFEGDQRADLFYHVNVMDSAFLEHVRKQNKSEPGKGKIGK